MHYLARKVVRAAMGLCLLTFTLAATSVFGQDIYMQDCPSDIGNTGAGYACGSNWFHSPDVVLRLTPVYSPLQDAPQAFSPAYIFVTLRNRGPQPSCCGNVNLYYRDASTGLSNFPADWTPIGSIPVCSIPGNGTTTVMFTWPSVPPNATPGQHFCLLARWDDDVCDPITAPGPSIYSLVPGDNNIVHKNCLPTTPGKPRQSFSVCHKGPHAARTRLRLKAWLHGNGRTLFDISGFRVKVILGDALFALWDGSGNGIQQVAGEPAVLVTDPDALIDGLNLPAGDDADFTNFIVNVEMQYPDAADLAEEAGNVYTWTLAQEDDDYPDGVDGMAFEVHMSDDQDGGAGKRVAAAPDLATTLALAARPNITSGSSIISFVLPERAEVSMAVYDAKGTLVRTLLAKVDRPAGAGEIEWDGRSSDGTPVASGTYFYRLTTPAGVAERQIKIVR
ncbi:MAG: hypothetical protein JST22_19440 [Bacteroidetes bacterium]|nr:hypothetical protein [Bacteroidota bacterium]